MKKIIFSFCMIFLAASFTSQLQAQTKNCTPAQMEACKKICTAKTVANTKANCTVAQKAACKKVCEKSASTKVASTNLLNPPSILTGYTTNDSKKPSGCSSSKLTNNSMPSCTAKKSKVVENKDTKTTPIAQKVVATSQVANN